MSALAKQSPVQPKKMCFDDFIKWTQTQEGKWELHDGVPVRKHDPIKGQAERLAHVDTKIEAVIALRAAIRKAGLSCRAVGDGATVPIDDTYGYIPDALVYCGDRLDGETVQIENPVIIVEVLSPSTAWKDVSTKLADYFRLPSVAHYLILDPALKRIQHHYRKDGAVMVREASGKILHLDPPGLEVDLEDIFS